jgi:peroxidase
MASMNFRQLFGRTKQRITSGKKIGQPANEQLTMELERLEERQLLSAVDIFAAGQTNQETLQLKIDDVVVQTWSNVGGDANAGVFEKLSFATDTHVDASRIKIAFVNDLYLPEQGIDRNLRIDKIVVDGVTYEAEDASVFSTGTWLPEDGLQAGFRQNEYLHTNGYMQFSNDGATPQGTLIEVEFRGSTGDEVFYVEVAGQEIARWQATTQFQLYSIHSDFDVTPDQIRVVFVNDLYDPANGIDRNLIIDRIFVNGQVIETESDAVFSTGTWTAEDGIQPGFRNSEFLHTNGYFQFGVANDLSTGGLANVVARTEFGAPNSISEVANPAVTPFVRVTAPSYPGDGSGTQWNTPEPSSSPQTPPNAPMNVGSAVQPNKITDKIFGPDSDVNRPNSGGLNEFSQFFGQFLAHDMAQSLTGDGVPLFYDGQQIPLTRTPSVMIDGVRQPLSSETPTLDLGLVYGRDAAATKMLREVAVVNGQRVAGARLFAGGAGDVLPTFTEMATHRGQSIEEIQQIVGVSPLPFPAEVLAKHVVTGDERANQTISLLVHHTIWHRNHNWHVDQLRSQNSQWSEEQLYQAARALNEAEYQNVIYQEYLPKLIGEGQLTEYSGFDPSVDNSIINEWTTVAFRFGHDQASDGQITISSEGEVNYFALTEVSRLANAGQGIRDNEMLGDWTRGQLSQFSQEIDGRVVSTLRENLFAVPSPSGGDTLLKFNLPLLDIHRGRDHGVSDYNQLRAGLGLSTYSSFEEFAQANGLAQSRLDQLKSVYSDISQLDSIVGGLLEAKVPGSQLGETFTVLNVMQFEATRDGDEFFYLNRFKDSPEIIQQVQNTSMNDILHRTGIIQHDHGHAFRGQPRIEGSSGRDVLYGTEINDLMLGYGGDDWLAGGEGNDILVGGDGNDWLFGQGQDDVLYGGAGNDFLNGGWGDDLLVGGSGYDTLTGGPGNDIFVFRPGSETDVVTDFSHGDQIDLSRFGFSNFGEFQSLVTYSWDSAQFKVGNDHLILKFVDELHPWDVII